MSQRAPSSDEAGTADGIGNTSEAAELAAATGPVEAGAVEAGAVEAGLAEAGPAGGSEEIQLDPDTAAAEAIGESPAERAELSEHAALAERLTAVTAERDDYRDQLLRQRAEFQNFRRRIESERQQQIAAGVSSLVESLLPVLDGCDAAADQGHTEVAAVGQALMVALGRAGLERIAAVGEAFDPTQHEAVTIEPAPDAESATADAASIEAASAAPDDLDHSAAADGTGPEQVVTAELRSGFRFEGRVLRAAMVQVRTE